MAQVTAECALRRTKSCYGKFRVFERTPSLMLAVAFCVALVTQATYPSCRLCLGGRVAPMQAPGWSWRKVKEVVGW